MSLTETLSALTAEVRSRRHQERFSQARSRHSVLEGFADLPSMVDHLGSTGERDVETSEALAVAFIAEQQASPSPLWTGLVLLLCTPMLCALRASVRGDAIEADELDATIIAHFLEVVQAHPVEAKSGRTLAALRSKTRRAVFRDLKLEQRRQTDERSIEPEKLLAMLDGEFGAAEWDTTTGPEGDALTSEEQRTYVGEQAALLASVAGGLLDDEQLELVVHTQVLRRSLTGYVEEHYPGLSAEDHTRTYERLKRQHGRSIRVVRDALAHLRHPLPPAESGEVGDLEDCG